MKRWQGVALTMGAVLFAGCVGSARIFYQDQRGGVLALEGDENKAFADAQQKMSAHCGTQGYQIVKRETVKVGSENYANTNTNYSEEERKRKEKETAEADNTGGGYHDHSSDTSTAEQEHSATRKEGGESTTTVTGTRDVTEVRVTYTCGAPPPPPPQ